MLDLKVSSISSKQKSSKKRIAFHTLGCKLNFSETSSISRDFDKNKFSKVSFNDVSDIYVINTCSVTSNADRKFKSLVNKTLKINDKAFIVAIGCYAQLQPRELASIHGVDLVLGANEKFKLPYYLNNITKNTTGKIYSCEIEHVENYVGSYSLNDRTRSFLKVQDGCDYKCTYCTIPLARGISRSDSLNNIISNANTIASKGVKEIVLTGVNIGDYGKGENGDKEHNHSLLDMIIALDKVNLIHRIRISSIEPNLLKNEIIEFVSKSKSFVPHFHIPLQSGSDEILKKMKRRYMTSLYEERVLKIKQCIPDACIGVDVICGFPGESEENFIETYSFLNDLPISYLHVFKYSERQNTEAFTMNKKVPTHIRNKRSNMLRMLSIKKRRSFYESQIGKKTNILLEGENKNGYIHGFTRNYVKVRAPWNPDLVNQIVFASLKEIDEEGFMRYEVII